MNKKICWTAFFIGLFAVGWVGVGYIGGSPLALAMTIIIGLVYVAGAVELRRFSAATDSLSKALAAIPDNLPSLDNWLASVDPSLQNAVRLRIEGERVGLPGPAMTPYLVGMLVLLGMLGTFLGMVVTLNGAVIALESTTDLHTIRAALAAPVKGLGVAFGTSVAGVAASTLLGLISALLRRDRLAAGRLLDARIATVLRGFSLTHQREETYRALQGQAQALPEMVSTLQTMMAQLERHNQQLSEQLLANQHSHYQEATRIYTGLAASVDQSLRASLTESARLAGATIQPVVEATMSGIARETSALHARMGDTVQAQLDGLAERFGHSVSTVTDTWTTALARQEAGNERLHEQLQTSLQSFSNTFDTRATALVASVGDTHARIADTVQTQLDGLAGRVGHSVSTVTEGWTTALARHEAGNERLHQQLETSLQAFADNFDTRSTALVASVGDTHARIADTVQAKLDGLAERLGSSVATVTDTWTSALARHEAGNERLHTQLQTSLQAYADTFDSRSAALIAGVRDTHAAVQAELTAALAATHSDTRALHEQLAGSVAAQLEGLSTRFSSAVGSVADTWTAALAAHERSTDTLTRETRESLAAFTARFEAGATALLATLKDSHATLQGELAAADTQRLAAMTASVEALAATLKAEWQTVGERTLAQQEQICQTLGDTARAMSADARAQASQTIGEVTRLMETAAEAPRAAAAVIQQLRQELSASMARDNTLLEERSRIMETLATLLDAINHASTKQRGAIDALVASSASLLEGIGKRFEARVDSESAKIAEATTRLSGGAVEVASLGEAFGLAVELFSESSDKLMETLQRIEGSLEKSVARSDEQLAYYVAQAREIIDLSVMSQKQIVENLQQLSSRQASLAGEG